MFKIRKINHRPWPVTIALKTCDDDGEFSESQQVFIAHFRAFREADLIEHVKAAEAAHPTPDGGDELPVALLLRRNAHLFCALIEGWRDIGDDEGAAIPYTPDALTALVTGPDGLAVSTGLNQAVAEIRFGIAPKKIAPTSPAPGPTPTGAAVAVAAPTTT